MNKVESPSTKTPENQPKEPTNNPINVKPCPEKRFDIGGSSIR